MAAPFQGPFSIQVESWVYNTGIAFNGRGGVGGGRSGRGENNRETKEKL